MWLPMREWRAYHRVVLTLSQRGYRLELDLEVVVRVKL